jgi:anaerobic ribonucleoside-triphosphate reductase activating protein
MKINVAGIVNESIVDGPGIRLTVFCQGCPHHCPGCQNPETWAFEEKNRIAPEQILEMVRRNPLVRGVTLSGGEPFSQAAEHAELASLLRAEGYEVAAYTGYTFEQLLQGTAEQRLLLENIDVLVDGPFLMEERTLEARFRGSRNQRVLDVPQSLKEERAVWMTRESWVGEQTK